MDICTCKCQTATFENVCTVDNQSVSPIFLNFSLFSSYYLYKFCPFASLFFPLHFFFVSLSLCLYISLLLIFSLLPSVSLVPPLFHFSSMYIFSLHLYIYLLFLSLPLLPTGFWEESGSGTIIVDDQGMLQWIFIAPHITWWIAGRRVEPPITPAPSVPTNTGPLASKNPF